MTIVKESIVNTNAIQPKEDMLTHKLKLLWGTGALGVAVMNGTIVYILLFYMVQILKIEPALAGGLLFVTKLIDVGTDPIVGIWSDRLKSKFGRRRPFLMPGAILCSLSFVLIFTTPLFDNQTFTVAYMFIALVIYTIGYTVFNVPYLSMPAEMTSNYHERSSIHSYRVVFIMIGGFLSGSGVAWSLEWLGRSEWLSYSIIGFSGAIIILVAMLTAYIGTAKAEFTEGNTIATPILGELTAIRKNPHFLKLIAVKACQLLAVSSAGAAMIFFFTSSLQSNFLVFGNFILVITVVSIIATPLLLKLSKKIGKRAGYMVSALAYVVCAVSWVFAVPGEPELYIYIRGAIIGVAVTGNIMLAMSMLTDTIEYDARTTGVRREGVYTSIYSFVEKFTHAFGPLIVGVALSYAGFNKDLAQDQLQSEQVQQALLLGMVYLPALLGVAAMVILATFDLNEDTLSQLGQPEAVISEDNAAKATLKDQDKDVQSKITDNPQSTK